MKFKLLLSGVSVSLFVIFSSLASSENFSGFYVGALAGTRFAELQEITTLKMPALNLAGSFPGRSVCLRGGEGGIVLGYGFIPWPDMPFYFGVESSYTMGRTQGGARYRDIPFVKVGPARILSGDMGQVYSQKDALKFVMRMGYAVKTSVSQFMPFVQFGLENARFLRKVYDNQVKFLDRVKIDLGTDQWIKSHTAPLVGGGIDFKLTENILFGFSFSYAFYNASDEKKIVATVSPQQAVAVGAAVAAVPGLPVAAVPPLAAGQQIETTVRTKAKFSRSLQIRLIYQF